jgi:dihydrofolate reductase
MGRIIVIENVSLDGVMQAPGREDEDTRDGFVHGGWGGPYFDPVAAEHAGKGMAGEPTLLFGRRTYEDFFKVWPGRTDNMFTDVLNKADKYVASQTLKEPLPWENSTLLRGEARETVAALKRRLEKDIGILGSGELVRSLMAADLVDELQLSIHPLVLGSGRRLFAERGALAKFSLTESLPTTTGVIIATYKRP